MKNQFSNLDLKEAHIWPILPKITLLIAIFVIPLIAGWYLYNESKNEDLKSEKAIEETNKKTFQDKYSQVQNLENLKEQKRLIAEQVKSLEGLLPNKAQMDTLLSDINQVGVNRNLNFELFEPSQASVKDYYALIPVNIKIKGLYHDIASFMSDVAGLSRIVNVQTLKMSNNKGIEQISLEGSLNTYRLLEEQEKKKTIDKPKI